MSFSLGWTVVRKGAREVVTAIVAGSLVLVVLPAYRTVAQATTGTIIGTVFDQAGAQFADLMETAPRLRVYMVRARFALEQLGQRV